MDELEDIFSIRIVALEKEFGSMDKEVLNATIPFELGYDLGGSPHVYFFSNHIPGEVCITAGLIGSEQKPNDAGNYEFMMAFKEKSDFGPDLICPLSYYTQEASLNSGETMGLPEDMTKGTNIKAIIFDCYKKFKVGNIDAGVMLIIGITEDELAYKTKFNGKRLIRKLKNNNVYPYTDFKRTSVV
ncbi:MAG: suppressor of fused domain protein [Sedimenticola sp.]